ncbi:class A beta-lactamase Bla1 [Schumannella luteola]|uniref:Beta-lactamase class A n=1 Tax=Schumannella luteola TaxID=472059 RepID=A0A852YEU3_9MICO|nr:class A beta-lactamase [Schumannella luteola]NYG98227.1 beta-lactamase class A [Schumannella luteola]TPX02157.1 class A beta-lactamase [Schumannella luteola]
MRHHRSALLAAPVLVALLAGCATAAPADATPAADASRASTAAADSTGSTEQHGRATALDLAALEQRYGARLGVIATDTATGRSVTWNADARFAHASTLKALAAGLVLRREGVAALDDPVAIPSAPLIDYSPVTEQHAGGTMTLGEVAAAAVELSDNTAGNLLFERLGGVDALQRELRKLGDRTTRVDRTEPELNTATPGDPRDTSTPRALVADLRALTLGGRGAALKQPERAALLGWLDRSQTGSTLIRAGLPAGWTAGDKSGAAGYGTRNDLAVVHPPNGAAPIVIAVLSSRDATGDPDADYDDALIAAAASAALAALRT